MLTFTAGEKTLEYFDISDPFFADVIETVRQRTLTLTSGVEAAWALYQSIGYLVRNDIPGDIVECGVWQGGSMLLAAYSLMHFGDTSRRIWLYDTFNGMAKPGELDMRCDGVPALPTWQEFERNGRKWGFGGSQEHVRNVVFSSGYPCENFVFVEGMVEDTLPATRPDAIGLLRLDTDLYSSTYAELAHLYPLLSTGGVLIIDDYGWLLGAQIATDQYIAERKLPLFLTRINESVRLVVKP